jgi:hypothetical protein
VKEGNIIFKDKIIGYIERSAAPDATQSRWWSAEWDVTKWWSAEWVITGWWSAEWDVTKRWSVEWVITG